MFVDFHPSLFFGGGTSPEQASLSPDTSRRIPRPKMENELVLQTRLHAPTVACKPPHIQQMSNTSFVPTGKVWHRTAAKQTLLFHCFLFLLFFLFFPLRNPVLHWGLLPYPNPTLFYKVKFLATEQKAYI